MSNKKILEALEFEKSKRDILRANQSSNNLKKNNNEIIEHQDLTLGGQRKYAWEYELEFYRKMRSKERFYLIGAVCGIIALILTLVINHQEILEILMKF